MDLNFTWNLLSSNGNNIALWLYGYAGTNTTKPVAWNFYYSLLQFLDTVDIPYEVASFSVSWNAYLRIFDINETPSLYQGCLPKYKFGSWAKSYAGLVFDQGFINYQYQRLCSGIFSTQQELFTPYGESDTFLPTTGVLGAEYLIFPTDTIIQGGIPNADYGDNVYTQVEVPAIQELFVYAAVDVFTKQDATVGVVLL